MSLIVKLKTIFLIIILSGFLGFNAVAQNNRQLINIGGGVGYSALNHGIEDAKSRGGVGFSLGAGYEYNLRNFILSGGAEFFHLNSETVLESYPGIEYNYMYPYINDYLIPYHYTFPEYQEKYKLNYFNIPLLIGVRFDKFYAMAGVKLGISLSSGYRTEAVLRTSAADPVLINPIEGLQIHGVGDKSFNQKGDLNVGFNLSPTLELGVYLDEWLPRNFTQLNNRRRTNLSYRAGLFIDYGVLNINKSATDKLLIGKPQNNDMWNVELNNLSGTELAKDKRFGTLFTGIKFTVLFDITKQKSATAPKKQTQQLSFPFYAYVVDAETHEGLNAEVSVRYTSGNRQIFAKNTDDKGYVSHEEELRKGRYTVMANAEGYESYRKVFTHNKPDTLQIPLQPVPNFIVHVIDSETNESLRAEVLVNTASDNKEVFKKETDPATGLLSNVLKGGRYQINISAEGYIYYQDIINHSKTDTLQVALQAIKKDVKVILHNLFFELNSANIAKESEPALEDLYQFLTKNPDVNIHIIGHTDNTGSLSYNMILSENRAKAVYEAIVSRGIDTSRVTFEGKGPNEPVTTNETEEGRAENRRVEFVIR